MALSRRELLVVGAIAGVFLLPLLPIFPVTETIQMPYTTEKPQVEYSSSYRLITVTITKYVTSETQIQNQIEFERDGEWSLRYFVTSGKVVSVSVYGRIKNLSQDTIARNVALKFVISGTEEFSCSVGTLKPTEAKTYSCTRRVTGAYDYRWISLRLDDIAYDPQPPTRTQATTVLTRSVSITSTLETFATTAARTETSWRPESRTSYASLVGHLGLADIGTLILVVTAAVVCIAVIYLGRRKPSISLSPTAVVPRYSRSLLLERLEEMRREGLVSDELYQRLKREYLKKLGKSDST